MPVYKIKWSNLLNLSEIEFEPEVPKQLVITNEIAQSLSWLTGATRHDRKLLRCDNNGVLLVGDAWSNLTEVHSDAAYPETSSEDIITYTGENKGVLITTSTVIVKVTFKLYPTAEDVETIYLPPNWLYWFPYPVYTVTVYLVPPDSGTECYVGLTWFN